MQSSAFVRLRFSNLRPHMETWYTVCIAPSSQSIPTAIKNQKKCQLELQLGHRFLLLLFKPLIDASQTGMVVNGQTYYPRTCMIIAGQPQERTLMSVKRRDSDMYCSHCVLQSPLSSTLSQCHSSGISSSSDDGSVGAPTSSRRLSVRNAAGQLSHTPYSHRYPSVTFRYQLSVSLHGRQCYLSSSYVAEYRRNLVSQSGHDFPRALGCFADQGYAPYNLYRIT